MGFFTRYGRALLLSAAVIVGAACISNGDNPAALVGQWVSLGGENVELFKDGTGVIDGSNITWKTEGKRFVLSKGNSSRVGDYNLSGYEFTRTFEGGEVVVWVRKGKEEEYKKKRFEKLSSYFTDSRNGQKYRSVKIGGKTWMADNLNYQTGKSWCYGNDNSSCTMYGRLYDWATAKTSCPAGWHLPSKQEWDALESAAGGDVAGKALKSSYGWNENGNGTDTYGFSALPGGGRGPGGSFSNVGDFGIWWTATEGGSGNAYRRGMGYIFDNVDEHYGDKSSGFSLRCVED